MLPLSNYKRGMQCACPVRYSIINWLETALVAAITLSSIPCPLSLKWRLFRGIALECGQGDWQRLPLQCSISRIGTGCGRAEARPYHKMSTLESHSPRHMVAQATRTGLPLLPPLEQVYNLMQGSQH
jgi:hypothetical protein